MAKYKKALRIAAEEAYKSEVVDTNMANLIIGEVGGYMDADYESREETKAKNSLHLILNKKRILKPVERRSLEKSGKGKIPLFRGKSLVTSLYLCSEHI